MQRVHEDLLRAKQGDPAARYRAMMIRRADPATFDAAVAAVNAELEARWRPRWGEPPDDYLRRVVDEVRQWRAFGDDGEVPIALPACVAHII